MPLSPTEQAEAILLMEGLGERCGRHIDACLAALITELEPLAAGGVDVSGYAEILGTKLHQVADGWQAAFEEGWAEGSRRMRRRR